MTKTGGSAASRLHDRIAQIQRTHYYDEWTDQFGRCGCGWKSPDKMYSQSDYPAHVADVMIAELGLREETRVNVMSSAGMTVDTKTGVTTSHSRLGRPCRWVRVRWGHRVGAICLGT